MKPTSAALTDWKLSTSMTSSSNSEATMAGDRFKGQCSVPEDDRRLHGMTSKGVVTVLNWTPLHGPAAQVEINSLYSINGRLFWPCSDSCMVAA